jgi:hypothetical protein
LAKVARLIIAGHDIAVRLLLFHPVNDVDTFYKYNKKG